ncbi:malate dehydrogenase (NAD) [Micromonospora pattaloongensis]|uniref:L-lactate dehydrogenase n=2 Tax=Micromonospora pattaloongensis TaxID=405436 RepID=A0A1H3MCN8_9ACTN|nr:malate dehydrogenase (NAD) [Micromonospora pattaloongensis]
MITVKRAAALTGPAVIRLIPSGTEPRPVTGSETIMGKKVTVVGAGFYGSTTAQRLAEYDIFDTVVLTDIVEGKPEGLALDMNQSRAVEGFETKVVGVTTGPNGEGYEAIEGSDIVVITAGLPRKPGMSRMDLLEVNAKIVRGVSENVAKYAPNAVVIVVSNPLDEMTALAQLATQFPKNRVLGQAGMLDTARFTNFVAETLAVPVASVKTLTLGSHGDTMVPVPSRSSVDGKPLAEVLPADKIEELVVRTRNGGAEVVALLKTGSAYYAPSAAAARMAKAVAEDSGAVMPVCAWVDGEYGISGVYLGVEAEIGAEGVKRVVETDLTESELAALKEAAEAVRAKQADVAGL